MTSDQFRTMINGHLLSYFPELKAYCANMKDATRKAWTGLFEGTDTRDFRKACDDFVSGRERLPFNRDELATRLLTVSRRHRDERMEAERRETNRENIKAMTRRSGSSDFAGGIIKTLEQIGGVECLKRIEERVEAGEDFKTVQREEVDRYMEQFDQRRA